MARDSWVATAVIGFLSEIITKDLLDGRNYQLVRPLVYITEVAGVPTTDLIIKVPKGFVTDFASIPRGLWNVFPPMGKYNGAAIVHDYLYRRTIWDREICDAVFLEAMQALGVNWLSRHLIYRVVRLFGGHARHIGHPSDDSSVAKTGEVGGGQSLPMGTEETHRPRTP